MKKVIVMASTALILMSCGGGQNSAKDIDVNSLETACECGDAVLSVAQELDVISNDIGDNEPSDEQKQNKKTLKKKMREIEKHCAKDKGFKKDEMEKCESFVEAQELMEK